MAVLNLTSFGLSTGGTGAANQAAFAAAKAAAVAGDTLYAPNGTYIFAPSGLAMMLLDKRLIVQGESRAGTIFRADPAVVPPSTTWRMVEVTAGGCTVTTLTIDGNKPLPGTRTVYDPLVEHHAGLFVGPNLDGFTLIDCDITNFQGDGLQIYNGVSNALIQNDYFGWNQRSGMSFTPTIPTLPVRTPRVTGCTFEGTTNQSIDNEHGPVIDAEIDNNHLIAGSNDYQMTCSGYIDIIDDPNRSQGWHIHDNVIEGSLLMIRCQEILVERNTFNNATTKSGIEISRGCHKIRVRDNVVSMTQTSTSNVSGILVVGTSEVDAGASEVLLQGNTVTLAHASAHGIEVNSAISVEVIDNVLTGQGGSAAGFAGVRMRPAIEPRVFKRGVIDGNTITNFGQYGVQFTGNLTSKLLYARVTRNLFVNTAGPMTTAISCGDSVKPVQRLEIGDNILGTGVTTLHVSSSNVALLFSATLPANLPAAVALRGVTPRAPILGLVTPPGVSVQQPSATPYRYAAEDAPQILRLWRSADDLVREGLPKPETLYPMQEASGVEVLDVIRGSALIQTIVGPGSRVGQPAHGIFTGRDFHGRRAVEISSAAAVGQMASPDTVAHNYASGSWAVLLVMRALYAPGTTAGVAGNRESTAAGWRLEINTSGRLQIVLRDASTTVTLAESGTHQVADGSWGWVLVKCNRAAGQLSIESSWAVAGNSTSISLGSIASTTFFRVGTFTGATAHPRCQLERMVTWTGVDAEGMSGARLGAWWNHGKRLSWMSSYSWTGLATSADIEDDSGLGLVVATWGPGQVMLARHAAITRNERKIGLLISRGVQQNISNTDVSGSGWATTSSTKILSDRTGPLGFRDGTRVTKSAASGRVTRALDVVNTGEMTASVYVFWDGTNTAPRIRIRDAGDTTTIAEATYAGAANKWGRLSVTWTSDNTAQLIQLHPSDPATTVGYAWFSQAQAISGNQPGPLMATQVGGFTNQVKIRAFAIGCRAGRGTMRAWFVALEQNVANATLGGAVASLSTVHGFNGHRRAMIIDDATEEPRAIACDGSSVVTATAAVAAPSDWSTVESAMTMRWAETEVDGYSVRCDRNAASDTDGGDLAAPGSTLIEALHVGSEPDEIRSLHGILSLLEVWPGYTLPV